MQSGQKLFSRGASMPHHHGGNIMPKVSVKVSRNVMRVGVQCLSRQARFIMREPDMTPPFTADNDACHLCNPPDLARFLKEHSCRVFCNGKPGRPSWTASFAAGTWIAARKQGALV